MAARTSVGVGIGLTIALLGVSTLALFVLTLVFWSDLQKTRGERDTFVSETKAFVSPGEMNSDDMRALKAEAEKNKKTVAAYMQESARTLSQKLTGTARPGIAEVVKSVDGLLGAEQTSVQALLADKDAKIAALTKSAADADASRQAALSDLNSQVALTKRQKEDLDKGVAAMSKDVSKVTSEADAYRAALEKARAEMAAAMDRAKRESEDKEAALNSKIAKMNEELLVAQGKIRSLSEKNRASALRPSDEAALVDAEVIGVDPSSGSVFINRGAKNHVVLGMTFEVYPDPAAIRPDPSTGEYSRGKASLEITKVDDSTATARVVRGARGQPVVRGDVLANAIYDPSKVYTFVVYGNFDSGDGAPTAEGQNDVKALIEQWGGKVGDTLAGDVDFLVLGARPVLPPAPPANAPVPVVQEFLRLQRMVKEYDRLLEQAGATSIPVLNQNRLNTLIGKSGTR